jgi:hypothetical protein
MSRVSLLLPNRDNERVLDMVIGRLAANTTYPGRGAHRRR